MNKGAQKSLPKINLSEVEINHAYRAWYSHYGFAQDDGELNPYLSDEMKPYQLGQEGWIRRARRALFYSTNCLAEKLDVDRQVFSSYEISEERGSISLATLAKAAESMGCELVYAIRPKTKTKFSQVIWAQLLTRALRHPWLQKVHSNRVISALASIAKELMVEPKFRKENSWSLRKYS